MGRTRRCLYYDVTDVLWWVEFYTFCGQEIVIPWLSLRGSSKPPWYLLLYCFTQKQVVKGDGLKLCCWVGKEAVEREGVADKGWRHVLVCIGQIFMIKKEPFSSRKNWLSSAQMGSWHVFISLPSCPIYHSTLAWWRESPVWVEELGSIHLIFSEPY